MQYFKSTHRGVTKGADTSPGLVNLFSLAGSQQRSMCAICGDWRGVISSVIIVQSHSARDEKAHKLISIKTNHMVIIFRAPNTQSQYPQRKMYWQTGFCRLSVAGDESDQTDRWARRGTRHGNESTLLLLSTCHWSPQDVGPVGTLRQCFRSSNTMQLL